MKEALVWAGMNKKPFKLLCKTGATMIRTIAGIEVPFDGSSLPSNAAIYDLRIYDVIAAIKAQ